MRAREAEALFPVLAESDLTRMNQRTKPHENSRAGLPPAGRQPTPSASSLSTHFSSPELSEDSPNAITFPTVVCPPPVLLFDLGGARAKAHVPEAAAVAIQARRPDRH